MGSTLNIATKVGCLRMTAMNVSPAMLLASGLLPLLAQFVSTCQQTNPAVAATPSPSPAPAPFVDLREYTPDDLAAYAGYCDAQVRAALSRGDTAAARGWANTRNSVQAEIRRTTPRPDRYRSRVRRHAPPSPRADQLPAATPAPEDPRQRPGYLLPPNWPTE